MTGLTRLGRRDVMRMLAEASIRPSRALGQNFVIDPNVTERIARIARIGPGVEALEIGAGLGSLTFALAATGASVTAVEIDRRLVEVLRSCLPETVRVVEADALQLDIAALYAQRPEVDSVVMVANLPYNVATPIVLTVLEKAPIVTRMVVMAQREVAERFASPPGSRVYGSTSARIAYFAAAHVVGLVSPDVFHPRPNVTSALVELDRHERPPVDPDQASYPEIAALVRLGFAGRRKTLRRSLSSALDESVFVAAGIDPTARAEDLSIVEWGKLAACLRNASNSPTPS